MFDQVIVSMIYSLYIIVCNWFNYNSVTMSTLASVTVLYPRYLIRKAQRMNRLRSITTLQDVGNDEFGTEDTQAKVSKMDLDIKIITTQPKSYNRWITYISQTKNSIANNSNKIDRFDTFANYLARFEIYNVVGLLLTTCF